MKIWISVGSFAHIRQSTKLDSSVAFCVYELVQAYKGINLIIVTYW